VTRYKSTDLY